MTELTTQEKKDKLSNFFKKYIDEMIVKDIILIHI